MSSVIKNYGSSLLLIAGVVVGGVFGVAFGEGAKVVAPVGQIFLNLIFTLIIPLVFFSTASSICHLKKNGSMGRTLVTMLIVFVVMSVIAGLLGYFGTLVFNPGNGIDKGLIMADATGTAEIGKVAFGKAIVSSLSVSDFGELLSKTNLLPLIIFSALFGIGTALTDSPRITEFLEQGMSVIMKILDIVMKAAPIGLGCYFADMTASMGGQIFGGYAKATALYLVLTVILFFVVNPLYILLISGKEKVSAFWKHIVPPSVTAVACASSTVAIPANIEAAKRMGVDPSIAESVVPLGITIHKDGSMISSVIKVVFIMTIFGHGITSPGAAFEILGIAIIAGIVTGAIPGGGMTGELLICNLLGLDPMLTGVIIVIGALIDLPATLLNSSSNVVATILVDTFVGRKQRKTAVE